jgi:hypothetical protein
MGYSLQKAAILAGWAMNCHATKKDAEFIGKALGFQRLKRNHAPVTTPHERTR